jgi:polyisoprenoid-binding protein YceI
MKNLKALALTLLVLVSAGTLSAQTTFEANPAKSTLKWLAKKVTGQHDGTVAVKSGSLTVNGGELTGGNFVLDMTTIKVADIADEGTNAKLVGHLNSDDFFSVEKHKEATFTITKVVARKGNDGSTHEITGDLTIKGITNSITFPAKVNLRSSGFIATAKFTIDRTKWDIKYGSSSFFAGIGDKAIYDDIAFDLYITSVK